MAEGWAHQWIQNQLDILKTTLQEEEEFEEEAETESKNSDGGSGSNFNKWARRIRDHISLLERTDVASVALDSSAVFDTSSSKSTSTSNAKCELSSSCTGPHCVQRKQVKLKAVEAMAKDGVDISSYKPKMIKEILPLLTNGMEGNHPHQDQGENGMETKGQEKFADRKLSQINNSMDHEMLEDVVTTPDPGLGQGSKAKSRLASTPPIKSVDKLIVLCSCGEEMKYELARRSKSVEEWSIDAPTAASKSGEGDQAYQRVSLEIKEEVNILMGSLLPKPFS